MPLRPPKKYRGLCIAAFEVPDDYPGGTWAEVASFAPSGWCSTTSTWRPFRGHLPNFRGLHPVQFPGRNFPPTLWYREARALTSMSNELEVSDDMVER